MRSLYAGSKISGGLHATCIIRSDFSSNFKSVGAGNQESNPAPEKFLTEVDKGAETRRMKKKARVSAEAEVLPKQ